MLSDPDEKSRQLELLRRREFEETAAGIRKGLEDVEAGRVTDLDKFLRELLTEGRG